MYGKANTHLLRIAGVIHILNNAYNILDNMNLDNKKKLTEEFKKEVDHVIQNEDLLRKITFINSDSLNYAKSLGKLTIKLN